MNTDPQESYQTRADVAAKLRNIADRQGFVRTQSDIVTCNEAADLLESLAKELAVEKFHCGNYKALRDKAESELAACRAELAKAVRTQERIMREVLAAFQPATKEGTPV